VGIKELIAMPIKPNSRINIMPKIILNRLSNSPHFASF
jgi:hypothetical protein